MDAHTEWLDKWWTDNDILWALETPSEWNWSDAKGLIIARHLWVQLQAERARVKELEDALRELYRAHTEVEDGWFSCPKAPGYFGTSSRDVCECGADWTNALIDKALGLIESDTPSDEVKA